MIVTILTLIIVFIIAIIPIIIRYKEEHLRAEEEKLSKVLSKSTVAEVTLKSLGSSVLGSKVYKVCSPDSNIMSVDFIFFFRTMFRCSHWEGQEREDGSLPE